MSVQGPHTRSVRDARLALPRCRAATAVTGSGPTCRCRPTTGARPIRVALVPQVPGGSTHAAQADGRAHRRPPSRRRRLPRRGSAAARHPACGRAVAPRLRDRCVQRPVAADAAGRRSRRPGIDGRLARRTSAHDLAGYIGALTERDALHALAGVVRAVATPGHAGAVRPAARAAQRLDARGAARTLASMRSSLIAPMLGLPGLGGAGRPRHGRLRTGRADHGHTLARGLVPGRRGGDRSGRRDRRAGRPGLGSAGARGPSCPDLRQAGQRRSEPGLIASARRRAGSRRPAASPRTPGTPRIRPAYRHTSQRPSPASFPGKRAARARH
jgi:hypothetical protein